MGISRAVFSFLLPTDRPPLAFALNAFADYLPSSCIIVFKTCLAGGGGGSSGVIPHETARFAPPQMSVSSFVGLFAFAKAEEADGRTICVTDSALLRVFAPLIDGRAAVPSLLFVHDGFTPYLSPSAQAPSPWSATARASSSAEDRRSGCSADGATGVPRGSTTAAPGLFVGP